MSQKRYREHLRALSPGPVTRQAFRTAAAPCFVPNGRRSFVLYAVTLREHPGVVKIGRTTNWNTRRREYENWNLAAGDGLMAKRLFIITEEWADLPALEQVILETMPHRRRHGKEWFLADLVDAAEHIARVLDDYGLTYISHPDDTP